MKRLTILLFIIAASHFSAIAQNNKVAENESAYLKNVLSERIYFQNKHIDIDTLKWNPHPTFKGVYLKLLFYQHFVPNGTLLPLLYHVLSRETTACKSLR